PRTVVPLAQTPPPGGSKLASDPPASVASRGGTPRSLQIVNKRQIRLDFEVPRVGPSGLGGVDVYVTTDDGQTWEKQFEEPSLAVPPTVDRGSGPVRGSVTVQLTREAVPYGFTLVAKSRAGLSKPPPQRGDIPQLRVELDTTLPEAELYRPRPDPNHRDSLVLTWKATDRNMSARPITIEWAERRDGPWN